MRPGKGAGQLQNIGKESYAAAQKYFFPIFSCASVCQWLMPRRRRLSFVVRKKTHFSESVKSGGLMPNCLNDSYIISPDQLLRFSLLLDIVRFLREIKMCYSAYILHMNCFKPALNFYFYGTVLILDILCV